MYRTAVDVGRLTGQELRVTSYATSGADCPSLDTVVLVLMVASSESLEARNPAMYPPPRVATQHRHPPTSSCRDRSASVRRERGIRWKPVKTVLMPKVWHLPLEDAKDVLAAAGVAYRVSLHQSLTVPEGEMFSVSPTPGTPLAEGQVATLNVSCGPPRRTA